MVRVGVWLVLLSMTIGFPALASERPVALLIPYWTPQVNQYFTDTYATCALRTINNAVEAGSQSFDEVELKIGKTCRSFMVSVLGRLQSMGLSTKEAKSLVNKIYRDRQYILFEFYTNVLNEKIRAENEKLSDERVAEAKGLHLECVQAQSAKYALLLSESAETVVKAAIGYCKPQEDVVAAALIPMVVGRGGNGASVMDGYVENVTLNATALVLELRTKQIEAPPKDVGVKRPADDGI
ncbi:hypothetical protein [Pleomorphomonas koreensis]|uniref:hypothetical protein n=1 Tax=Pleomorphomonas koreensis TaxID=257440 RepID=UPI00146AB714|nr:hypothetical protein [Pleomorphomonas koreensis]